MAKARQTTPAKDEAEVVVEKNVSKETTKTKETTKKKTKKEKKPLGARIVAYFSGLKKELKRVHFPSKKDLIKYSVATIVFIIFFALFFYLISVLYAALEAVMR